MNQINSLIMGPYRQQFVAPHADLLWSVPGVSPRQGSCLFPGGIFACSGTSYPHHFTGLHISMCWLICYIPLYIHTHIYIYIL